MVKKVCNPLLVDGDLKDESREKEILSPYIKPNKDFTIFYTKDDTTDTQNK